MLEPKSENKELRPAGSNKKRRPVPQVRKEPTECQCGMVYTSTKAQPNCPQCFRRPPL